MGRVGDREEDRQGQHRLERSQGEVEECFQRALAAHDHEGHDHADQARQDQLSRTAEEEADHERQLVHREQVPVVAEVHVHGEAVGEGERDRQERPRHVHRLRDRRLPADDRDEENHRRSREGGAEEGDLARRGHLGPRLGSR